MTNCTRHLEVLCSVDPGSLNFLQSSCRGRVVVENWTTEDFDFDLAYCLEQEKIPYCTSFVYFMDVLRTSLGSEANHFSTFRRIISKTRKQSHVFCIRLSKCWNRVNFSQSNFTQKLLFLQKNKEIGILNNDKMALICTFFVNLFSLSKKISDFGVEWSMKTLSICYFVICGTPPSKAPKFCFHLLFIRRLNLHNITSSSWRFSKIFQFFYLSLAFLHQAI